MKLTTKMLRAKKACAHQRELFDRITGGELDVTVEWCCEHALNFDWDWAATNLLTDPARAAYGQDTEAARAAYGQDTEAAWAAYDQVEAAAWAAFDQAVAAAWAAYVQAVAAASAAYGQAKAAAWAIAYNSQGSA
jgi:hypothetical protein